MNKRNDMEKNQTFNDVARNEEMEATKTCAIIRGRMNEILGKVEKNLYSSSILVILVILVNRSRNCIREFHHHSCLLLYNVHPLHLY